MTELQGAVALAQLAKARGFVERRRHAARVVTEALRDALGITPAPAAADAAPVYWYYLLTFDTAVLGIDQPHLLRALRAEGIPAGPVHSGAALHLQDMFQRRQVFGTSHYPFDYGGRSVDDVSYAPGTCPVAEELADPARSRSVMLPMNEGVTDEDAAEMTSAVRKVAEHYAARS